MHAFVIVAPGFTLLPRPELLYRSRERSYIMFHSTEREERVLSARPHMILLVDDDHDVRETSADMLEELGYRVVQASSGKEALDLLDGNPDLDVMVTDIRMPGMSGLELSDLAGDRHRDLKIILISGYFLPQPIQRRFLQKPFRTHDLDAAIRAELGWGGHA